MSFPACSVLIMYAPLYYSLSMNNHAQPTTPMLVITAKSAARLRAIDQKVRSLTCTERVIL